MPGFTDERRSTLLRAITTCVPLAILLAGFAGWLSFGIPDRTASLAAAAAMLLLFSGCIVRLIPQWRRAWSGDPIPESCFSGGRRSTRRTRMHPFFRIVLLVALSRLILFLAGYIVSLLRGGYAGGIFDHVSLWNPVLSDAQYYLAVAEGGYTDPKLLAFFPFYPVVVRAFSYVFRDTLTAGLFVSGLSFLFAAYLLYELALFDTDRDGALRAVRYLCILPASFLLMTATSDALFLLLTLACLLLTRKKKILPACLVGLLAAFTALPGVLLILPVGISIVADCIADRHAGESGRAFVLAYMRRFACLLLIAAGFAMYLILNQRISGDAFYFAKSLSADWGRGLSWFFNTASYQTSLLLDALGEWNIADLAGLWLPNLLSMFGALAVFLFAIPRLRTSYSAYFLAYFMLTMGASQLISAPRLLMAAFPLPIAVAALTKKRWADILLTICSLAALGVYLYAFIRQWRVV